MTLIRALSADPAGRLQPPASRRGRNGPARRVLTMAAGGWGDPGDSPNRFGLRDAPDAGGESAPPPEGTAPDRF
jgi:hypothetical protein